jgi:hypothetical protein
MAAGEFGYSIPSSCPSPFGEGTQGPAVWAGASALLFDDAPGQFPSLSPRKGRKRGVERKWRQVNLAIPSPLPALLPLAKGLRALAFVPHHSIKRPGQRLIPGPEAGQGRQPQRVQPGDANAGSECRLVRLFPSPFGPVKKGTPHSRSQHQPRVPLPLYPPCLFPDRGPGQALSREGTRARPRQRTDFRLRRPRR